LSLFSCVEQCAINLHLIIGQTVHFIDIDKSKTKVYAKYKY